MEPRLLVGATQDGWVSSLTHWVSEHGGAQLVGQALTPSDVVEADFDVLVVDVFSGDSIPLHLLTKQAFEQYRRHLKDDGVLAVHISNLYLDLAPVVRRLSTEIQTTCVIVQDKAPPDKHLSDSIWALLLTDPRKVEMLLQSPSAKVAERVEARLWTDDYVNLLSALR